MKRLSDTEEPQAQSTSKALMDKGNRAIMTSTPNLLAFKWIKPNDKISTSDSDENQPPAKRRKRKKNPKKYEAQVVKTTPNEEIFQPPLIEYATSQSSQFISKKFDLELKKRHEELHAAALKRGQQLIDIEVGKPINPNTSCGTSLSSIEMSGHSSRSESVVQSPSQLDHSNVEKRKNEPDVPIEAEDRRFCVISIDECLAEDSAEQESQTEAPTEAENHRKRTISVEDCEINIEMKQSTRMNDELEIETVDLSIDDQAEVEYENNIVREIVPAKSLRSAAVAAEEPKEIDDNDRSLVMMTEKPNNSFRRHRYKKTPRRMKALEDIKRLQSSVDLLIPKRSFQRLVHEIMTDQQPHDFHIQNKALLALHEAAEMHLIELFEETHWLSLHRDRATVALKDIQLALKLQEHYELNHRYG